MANYQSLLDTIANNITTNGNNEITGAVLKSVLQSMVSGLGANATFGGIAHIADVPGTPDGSVVYIASEVGTYPNFGGLTIDTDELAVFVWDADTSTWSKASITYIADKSEMEEFIQDGINDIGDAKTDALNAISTAIQGLNIYYDVDTDNTTSKDIQLKDGDSIPLYPKNTSDLVNYTDLANDDHVLTDKMDELTMKKVAIDFTNYNTTYFSSNSNNKWGTTYKGIFVPVNAGEIYELYYTGVTGIIIPLKVLTFKNNTSYESNIATGYSTRIIISPNTKYLFTIPSDCTVLYIQATSGQGSILPTMYRLDYISPSDTTPTLKSNAYVTSDGIARELCNMTPLSEYYTIYDFYLNANMTWVKNTSNRSALYQVNGGDVLHLVGNESYGTYYSFIGTLGTPTEYGTPTTKTSCRYAINANESIDVVVPQGTTYLCILRQTSNGLVTPCVYRYGNNNVINFVSGNTVMMSNSYFLLDKGIYRISLDKTEWDVSTFVSQRPIFSIYVDGIIHTSVMHDKYFEIKKEYYLYIDTDSTKVIVGMNGNVGEELNVKIDDVSNDFNKEIYDVAFVDGSTTSESMMVRLGEGDLIKYKLNTSASSTPIKMYSRSVRDDTYLVDSITSTDGGVIEGTYMPTSDVYVVMTSVIATRFTPSFKVYNYGASEPHKIRPPYQLIFDTDNITTILSSEDADATQYDNEAINYGQIIPFNGIYYLIYQGFGTYGSTSNICMAYSTDGSTWQRGFPNGGDSPVVEGTNLIFTSGQIVGLFETEHVNEFVVVRVNDTDYPFRGWACIRNANPNVVIGERHYMFKSADLVNWTNMGKIENHAHDSIQSLISYGDKIKAYVRMWDYRYDNVAGEFDKQRMIGEMWFDIWGNVITPPSGLWGRGLYNPACTPIGFNRELFLPTRFINPNDKMNGDNSYEAYINDNGIIRWCPVYHMDDLKFQSDADGWGWGTQLVGIGLNQYFIYSQRNKKHNETSTTTQLRLCPVNWVTYDLYNRDGE